MTFSLSAGTAGVYKRQTCQCPFYLKNNAPKLLGLFERVVQCFFSVLERQLP